jgi:hypothetical protein
MEPQHSCPPKSISYSKIVYDQLTEQDDEDDNIPEEFAAEIGFHSAINGEDEDVHRYSNICYDKEGIEGRESFGKSCNTINRTFTSMTFNSSGHQYTTSQEKKRLPFGLASYRDIKSGTL